SQCRRRRVGSGAARAWVQGLPASRAIRAPHRRERRERAQVPPALDGQIVSRAVPTPRSPVRDGGGSVAAMRALEGLRDACPALALHTDGPALTAGGPDALRPARGPPAFAAPAPRPLAVAEPARAAGGAAPVGRGARAGGPPRPP